MQLHRSDVLNAALELLDAQGLDALSMRRLAIHLNVSSGTVFWHFSTKQALLDAIAEHLLEGVGAIDAGQPGLDQIAELAVRLRQALLSHRDGARVVSGTFVSEPNTLRFGDAAVRAALAAGVPAEKAVLTAFTIQYFVLGQTIEEQAAADFVGSKGQQPRVDAEHSPDLRAAIEEFNATSAEQRFHYGLAVLLDGIDRQTEGTSLDDR
jgi:TetR/AcrR family transcriptional regulator, tetracycline repressor protein